MDEKKKYVDLNDEMLDQVTGGLEPDEPVENRHSDLDAHDVPGVPDVPVPRPTDHGGPGADRSPVSPQTGLYC